MPITSLKAQLPSCPTARRCSPCYQWSPTNRQQLQTLCYSFKRKIWSTIYTNYCSRCSYGSPAKCATTLPSLQSFYDTVQSHVRSLTALGKPPDSYSTLLTSVILGKLSADTKACMARDHYDTEWTIDELLASVLKEIRIFEAGQDSKHKHSNTRASPLPTTTSFYTGADKIPQPCEKPKKDPLCALCKGTHRTNSCTLVMCTKERLAIVKSVSLCFNCIAWHKVSQCPSKFTCKNTIRSITPASAMLSPPILSHLHRYHLLK